MVGDLVAIELSAMMEDDSSVMMGCRAGLCFLLCAEERRMRNTKRQLLRTTNDFTSPADSSVIITLTGRGEQRNTSTTVIYMATRRTKMQLSLYNIYIFI